MEELVISDDVGEECDARLQSGEDLVKEELPVSEGGSGVRPNNCDGDRVLGQNGLLLPLGSTRPCKLENALFIGKNSNSPLVQ